MDLMISKDTNSFNLIHLLFLHVLCHGMELNKMTFLIYFSIPIVDL